MISSAGTEGFRPEIYSRLNCTADLTSAISADQPCSSFTDATDMDTVWGCKLEIPAHQTSLSFCLEVTGWASCSDLQSLEKTEAQLTKGTNLFFFFYPDLFYKFYSSTNWRNLFLVPEMAFRALNWDGNQSHNYGKCVVLAQS